MQRNEQREVIWSGRGQRNQRKQKNKEKKMKEKKRMKENSQNFWNNGIVHKATCDKVNDCLLSRICDGPVIWSKLCIPQKSV
jgi:hypothetical protein